MSQHSDGEETFAYLLRTAGRDIPEPVREYKFAVERDYRLDFAWLELPGSSLIKSRYVEIDGGNDLVRWSERLHRYITVGRHTQDEDYWKLNLAAGLGWRGVRFTPTMLDNEPDRCLDHVRMLLGLPLENGRYIIDLTTKVIR